MSDARYVTSVSGPLPTLGVAGDMAVAGWTCAAQAATAAYTPPASMTERADANDAFPWQRAAVATQARAADGSTGTLTATLTGATARPWYGVSMLAKATVAPVKPRAFMPFSDQERKPSP